MLDLGAWMPMPILVCDLMNEDLLASNTTTIQEALEEFDGSTKLTTIACSWELVLDLIMDDKGGINLMEMKLRSFIKLLVGSVLPCADMYCSIDV